MHIPARRSTAGDLDDLVSAFARLDVQASSFRTIYGSRCMEPPIVPPVFMDLDDARESLNSLITAVQWVRSHYEEDLMTLPYTPLPDEVMENVTNIQQLLSSWFDIFTRLIKENYINASIKYQGTINVIFIHYFVAWINISTYFYRDQTAFDNYNAQFGQIIIFATAVSQADQADDRLRAGSSAMLDIFMGMVQPLYFVVRRCRDPAMRRKAIEIMEKVRQERVNDVQTLAKVSKWIVEREEEGLAKDERSVVEETRFHEIELDFNQPGMKCKITAARRDALGRWEDIVGTIS
jgi:hypothetical protein